MGNVENEKCGIYLKGVVKSIVTPEPSLKFVLVNNPDLIVTNKKFGPYQAHYFELVFVPHLLINTNSQHQHNCQGKNSCDPKYPTHRLFYTGKENYGK
jgi:hypothetical protein